MKPAVQHLVSELYERRLDILNRLHRTLILDEVAVKRLEKDLSEQLEKPGLSQGLQAGYIHELAYMSGFRLRSEEAVQYLDLAEQLGIDPFAISLSKSYLLGICGRFIEARDVIEKVDVVSLKDAQRIFLAPHYVELGMFRMAGENIKNMNDFDLYFEEAREILASNGIDDSAVTARLDFAAKLIVERARHPIIDYRLFAMRGEGILYRFVVKGEIDDLATLSRQLSDALVDNFNGPLDEVLSIDISPLVPGHESLQGEVYRVGI